GSEPPPASWRFVLALEGGDVDGQPWPGGARLGVVWRDGSPALADGDRVELTGLAENVRGPRNPGEFDLAALARRRGIYSELRVTGPADGRVLASPGAGRLAALAARVHDTMERTLRVDLQDDPETGNVVATMLLGLRDDPGLGDLEGMFQRTGTLHYFAVDGLKLGLVAAVLWQLLSAAGLSRAVAGLLVLPVLGVYALATGLEPASGRALIVAAALVGGRWLDRSAQPLNSLGAAALVLLCHDTNELFAVSFQLTFLVVLAILLFAPGLARWFARGGAPDPFLPTALFSPARRAWEWLRRRSCELLAVALAAWAGSLPVMAWYFGVVSPVSPVANVVAFPLAFAVVALGTLSLGGAWAARWWVVCLNNANWLCAHALLAVVRWFDAVPGGSVAVPDPSAWRWGGAPLAEVEVLDLGRARAAFVRAGPGADWLIDAGRPGAYGRAVRPALRAAGVTRLGTRGGLILTQADANHVSAAGLALAELGPRQVVDCLLAGGSLPLRDFRRTLDPAREQETRVHRGGVIDLARGMEARVLYPPSDPPPGAPVTA
ncbi:MAG: ComEC/Rec2 family competence protein, partial [Caulobacteraceae bacterium]|nr:ComEC/Rec2 family competence protein [Caulobacter sp.]